MLNPWVLLGLLVAWAASLGGAFVYGQSTKADAIEAQVAREEKVAQKAADAATVAAAVAIARIKPINTTIRQETERVVRVEPQYRDCTHPPEMVDRINQSLTGRAAGPSASAARPSSGERHADGTTPQE